MKKVTLLLLSVIMALVSMAAAPIQVVLQTNTDQSDFTVSGPLQGDTPLCWNPVKQKFYPCPPRQGYKLKFPGQGEPRLEKISFFHYVAAYPSKGGYACKIDGVWNFGCMTWYYHVRTFKLPQGCNFRYQY